MPLDTPFLLDNFINKFLGLSSETGAEALENSDLSDVHFPPFYHFDGRLVVNPVAFNVHNRVPGLSL